MLIGISGDDPKKTKDPASEILALLDLGDGIALQVLVFLVGVACIKNQNECVRGQLLELETNNKILAQLNAVLGKLLGYKSQLPPDIDPKKEIQLPEDIKAALASIGIDPEGVKVYGDLTRTIEEVRSRVDQYNSIGQTFATRLQMEINSLQVFSDMTTNSLQTLFNSLKSIMRNLV